MSKITQLLDRTEDYYNTIYNRRILSYKVENGISITVFEGDICVIVNFTNQAVTYEGRQIDPMDFEIIC